MSESLDVVQEMLDKWGDFGASDIHITSDRGTFYVKDKKTLPMTKFQVDGEVLLADLVDELLPGGRQVISERGQAGASFDQGGKYRGRVALRREQGGTSCTIRIISYDIPSVEKLGMPAHVTSLINKPSGLILYVGQTGSGKSTSIASMVNLVNTEQSTGIYTIESPIEYVYPPGKSLVIQREVGMHTQTFGTGVEDAKRSHPRIIVVGEILNTDTARAALLAAASGHLVISTMHAGTAAEAIDSFVSMFTPEEQGLIRTQMAQSLQAVIAQRLIPKPSGGMALAQEIAFNTREMQELIRGSGDRGNDTKFIQQLLLSPKGEAENMQAMEMALARLVVDGAIDLGTARANARDLQALDEKLAQLRGRPAQQAAAASAAHPPAVRPQEAAGATSVTTRAQRAATATATKQPVATKTRKGWSTR